ncbi:MAG: magnesium transporter [Candidatus Anammoxibacter sp.]
MEKVKWYKILTPDIKEMIVNKELKALRNFLTKPHPADTADLLRELSPSDRVLVFRLLTKDIAVEVFALLEPAEEEELLNHFTERRVKEILMEMDPDDRTQLLDELPAEMVKRFLSLLPQEEREEANLLLNYPSDSAGRLMTTEYVDLRLDMTITEALQRIRETGPDRETIYTCYVIDGTRHLCGVTTLKDIILASPDKKIEEITNEMAFTLKASDDQETAAKIIQKYDLLAVPVVDSQSRLVGIITVDDVLDVVQEEATEDFHKMAAIQVHEESYFRGNFFKLVSKRVVWLVILILAATISGKVLKSYSAVLSSIIALTYFIPMLTGAGGNIGSQSSTLVIRALATGDITLKQWLSVIKREVLMGGALGVILGVVAFAVEMMLLGDIRLGITVGISLTVISVVGNTVGTVTPLLFKFLKLDPAFVSSPLIATVLDVSSLLIYFSIAGKILAI